MPQRQLRIVPTEPAPAADLDALRDSPALRGLLARSLRAIVALTGARGGAVRMVPAGERAMRLMAAEGLSDEWLAREQHVSIDCGMCGTALRDDCLQLDAQAGICVRRSVPFAAESAHGPAIAVPLHCRGRAVGVFNLFFAPEARLPADASSLVAPVSEMLEIALDNAIMESERLRSSLVAERQMLAGEVHDSLAQGLAFMRMRMSLLNDALARGEGPRVRKYFDEVNVELGEAHARLRSLITHFRHTMDQGLVEALRDAARGFEERTGVALRIEDRAPGLRLTPERQVEAYQIVQEALANVIKHSGASNAHVVIERTPRRLQVTVEDDGCGLPRDMEGGEHYGIEIMRERAQRLGGSLDIRSLPRKGTRVRLVVPAPALEAKR